MMMGTEADESRFAPPLLLVALITGPLSLFSGTRLRLMK